jgi:hypothetical protein
MHAACEQKLAEGLGGYATALAAATGVEGDPERAPVARAGDQRVLASEGHHIRRRDGL